MGRTVGHLNRYLKIIIMLVWLVFLVWYHNQLGKITVESPEELILPFNEEQGKKQISTSKKKNDNILVETTSSSSSGNSNPKKYLKEESSIVQECDATGAVTDCCCPMACTDAIMQKSVGMFTCKQRIHYVMTTYALTLRDACVKVAKDEHPLVCGKCNPDQCPVPVKTVYSNKYNEHIG